MYEILIPVILIICVLLILIVMVQNPKGGLSGDFGSASQMMGVKKTTDLLEKLTYGFMFAIALLATYVNVDMQPNTTNLQETEQVDEPTTEDTSIP